MSSTYKPPGSKKSSTSQDSPQRNRFTDSKPDAEKPPDTSCDSLFPELSVTPNTQPPANKKHISNAWGKVSSAAPNPAITPSNVTNIGKELETLSAHCKKNHIIEVDNRVFMQTMHNRKMEERELNALSGYRNDYIYLHELDEPTYSDSGDDSGDDSDM
jgi:hypothetical protein